MKEDSNKNIHISEISLRIKALITNLDLKDKEFANRLEVGTGRLSNILNGRNKPDIEFVSSIVVKFRNVNSFWLLTGIGEMFLEDKLNSPSNVENEVTELLRENRILRIEKEKLQKDLAVCKEQGKREGVGMDANISR